MQFLEGKLPLEERKGMSVVLDRLVERFMEDERYHNDPRYVDHCIKCVSCDHSQSSFPKIIRLLWIQI